MARKISRSSSPVPPNLISKLTSQIEKNNIEPNKQRESENKNENRRSSPYPSLTIKLSSIKAKKILSPCQGETNLMLSDSSNSEYESPQPRLSKAKTKPLPLANPSRQRASILGDDMKN